MWHGWVAREAGCTAETRPSRPAAQEGTTVNIHDQMSRQGLVRPVQGRVLAGVCAGLGQRFGISPWAARLLFVLLLMVLPGSQILVYPILWILMPSESPQPAYAYGPPRA